MTHHSIHRLLPAVAAAFVMTILGACSSHRSSQTALPGESGANAAPAQSAKKNPEVADLASTYSHWTSLYAPFSMQLKQPLSFNVSGRATMVNGQAINLSLRVLGMEVAIVYVDTDSAYLVDKFHKQFVAEPLAALTSRTDITIADLQAILLGQAVYPGKGPLKESYKPQNLFSIAGEGDSWVMTPKKTRAGATWYFTVAPGPVLTGLTVEPRGLDPIVARFSDFATALAGNIAQEISVEGKYKTRRLDFTLEWNMGRAEWDSSRTASAPKLEGYRRLSIDQILKSLKSR